MRYIYKLVPSISIRGNPKIRANVQDFGTKLFARNGE